MLPLANTILTRSYLLASTDSAAVIAVPALSRPLPTLVQFTLVFSSYLSSSRSLLIVVIRYPVHVLRYRLVEQKIWSNLTAMPPAVAMVPLYGANSYSVFPWSIMSPRPLALSISLLFNCFSDILY